MASTFDLVVMTVSSAFGTSTTIPLNAAATINGVTYLTFTAAGASTAAAGTTVDYSILDTAASEIGTALFISSANTLTSRTPTKSTNAGAAITASSAALIRATIRAENLPLLTTPNTFTSSQAMPTLALTSLSTVAWGITSSGITVTVGPSSFVNLADGSGMIILTDSSFTGATGMYLTGGSAAALVSQTTTGAPYVAPSSTPASSKYSVQFSTGSHYAIFNGASSAVQFFVSMISVRPTI